MSDISFFIEFCDMVAFVQPDKLLGEEEYKECDWSEADRLQLRQLQTTLGYWKAAISEQTSDDAAEQQLVDDCLDYWLQLPGQGELKRAVWHLVVLEPVLARMEALDVSQL